MRVCFNCHNNEVMLCGSSNALFDYWSFAHVLIGGITGLIGLSIGWFGLLFSLGFAICWEIFENSRCGIWCCQRLFCDVDYKGDNIFNSLSDIICNMLGSTIVLLIIV
tara:strand:+ start:200 stop:523 length:324 start_codon:yes stop_codon:yes gene_type:complete